MQLPKAEIAAIRIAEDVFDDPFVNGVAGSADGKRAHTGSRSAYRKSRGTGIGGRTGYRDSQRQELLLDRLNRSRPAANVGPPRLKFTTLMSSES